LQSANTAIALTPTDRSLYELRRDIERALGYSEKSMAVHLAEGYREAGNALAALGQDAQAMALLLKGVETISARRETNDDAVNFELERSIRNLSDFIVAKSGVPAAQVFWRNLAQSSMLANFQRRAENEVQRVSSPP
jgi:hypothetical protein